MSISTRISNYSKPHNNGNGGGGGYTYIRGGVSNTDLPADLTLNSISAVSGNINNLTGISLDYNDGKFIYLNVGNGKIAKLRGDELKYEHGRISDFHSDSIENTGKITTNELEVTANAFIKDLTSNTITTDYLTVTKQAHFFELVIDKVRSVGGTLMLTPAQCIADYVKAFAMSGGTPDPDHDTEIPLYDGNGELIDNVDVSSIDYYVIYWLAQDDGTGRKNSNDWIVDDQAYCTSFNVAAGVNYNVSNKYYWRLVIGTFGEQYLNLNTGKTLPLAQATNASVNSVFIDQPYIYYSLNGVDNYIYTDWYTYSQVIGPTYDPGDTDPATGATWSPVSGTGGAGEITQGTMTTKNTIFGIQLQPREGTALSEAVPEKFGFTCGTNKKARLNVGIYYSDNSSEWFSAPEKAQNAYELTLKAVWDNNLNMYVSSNSQTIETVVITNADDVEWKLVHSIALSNNRSECDVPQDHTGDQWFLDKSSIPSIGDNITQLGYRYQNVQGYPTGGTDQQIKDWINSNRPIYDRSSAQIISANKTPDTEVTPPAYAQYTGINDFSLSTHRGTWIDATGGYFKGKLVTESGYIDITDQGLGIEADFYKIIPSSNVITLDSNDTIIPSSLGVSFLHSGDSNLITSVPTGCSFNYSIDGATPTSIPASYAVNINISNMTGASYLVMNLYKEGETPADRKLLDSLRMTVTDVQVTSGLQGLNGQYTQYAYKNASRNPGAPTSDSNYPPTGDWTETPSTPDFEHGEYTWCTTRKVTFDSSNQPIYGPTNNWCTPYRITGDNGQPGEDGNYTEFVYILKSEETTFTGQANPANWDSTSAQDKYGHSFDDRDYVGPTAAGWDDNPKGISATYKFEYMSWREYDGETDSFSSFSQPVIWSRWGENGRDGDGVEYIFCRVANETAENVPNILSTSDDIYPYNVAPDTIETNDGKIVRWREDSLADWRDATNYDFLPIGYFVPIGGYDYPRTNWTDDPTGVDEDYTCEYVSIRKYIYDETSNQSSWQDFSEPTIWSMYGGTGPIGPQGPQGSAGPTGPGSEYYTIIPVKETFEVRINADNVGAMAYENITGKIYTDVAYSVVHVDGDTVTYLSKNDLQDLFKLEIISNTYGTYNYESGVVTKFEQGDADYSDNFTYTTARLNGDTSEETIGAIRFQTNNILTLMWPNNTSYHDYYYLHTNQIGRAPIQLNVALVQQSDDAQLDHRTIQLIFKASHLFSVADTALNSIYQGLSGSNGRYTDTGFSRIKQTWDEIGLSVNNLRYANDGDLPQDTDIEEYIYQRNNSSDEPTSFPQQTDWDETPEYWCAYNDYPEPTTSNRYVWQSYRTRPILGIDDSGEISYGDPTEWSYPILYEKYGVRRNSVNSAQLSMTADEIRSTVSSNYYSKSEIDGMLTDENSFHWIIDLAGHDENTYYPVGVHLQENGSKTKNYGDGLICTLQVDRSLNESGFGGPEWGSKVGDNYRGVSLICHWTVIPSKWGAWGDDGISEEPEQNTSGNLYVDRYILMYTGGPSNHNDVNNAQGVKVIGNLEEHNASSTMIFYLRGGSKYNLRSTWNFPDEAVSCDSNKIISPGSSYTTLDPDRDQTTYNSISGADSPYIKVPVQDRQSKSEIIQTATQISLSVFEGTEDNLKRTGIDIESGKIDLTSDNTNIIGNLNIAGSGSAFQFVDDDGNVKLRIGDADLSTKDKFLNTNNLGSASATVTYAVSQGTTSKMPIGEWSSGTVSVDGYKEYCYLRQIIGTASGQFDGTGVTVYLKPTLWYYNGSSYTKIGSGSEDSSTLNNKGYFNSNCGGGSWSVSSSGTYFVSYDWRVRGLDYSNDAYYILNFTFEYDNNNRVAHVGLANNGFGIAYNANEYDYFYTGRESTEISYGNPEDWNRKFAVNNGGVHVGRRNVRIVESNAIREINWLGDYYIEWTPSDNFNFNFTRGSDYFVAGDYFQIFNLTDNEQQFKSAQNLSYRVIKNHGASTASGPFVNIRIPSWTKLHGIWDGSKFWCFFYELL